MKRLYFGFLIVVLVTVSLFTACSSTSTQTSSQATAPVTSSLLSTTTVSPISITRANWWDKLGTPQYGGSITITVDSIIANFDPYTVLFAQNCYAYEGLFYPSWTVDRTEWAMAGGFVPEKYYAGNLAESWELTDQQTITVHLRQGLNWQNKAPVNGREFTSEDIVFHYDRLMGTGHGYKTGSMMASQFVANWDKVTATDKYTIVFHFKKPMGSTAFLSISDLPAFNWFEASEWVALGGPPVNETPAAGGGGPPGPPAPPVASGPLSEWQNVVGTGPWILTDFLVGSQMTYEKNPTYWGHDPRYPQNQVPYVDTLKLLQITDISTKVAALRTGKIDYLAKVDWQHAESLNNTDLHKVQVGISQASGVTFRNDLAPFSDIRVRKALNMAIDRPAIAKNVYNGLTDGTPCGAVAQVYKGYAYQYKDWLQNLKDEYAFNPTKAKQLLTEAGYSDGFKTNVVIMGNAQSQLMEVFKSYFKDIGVDMEIRSMEPMVFSNFTMGSGKHDAMAESKAGIDSVPSRVIELFYSKSKDSILRGLNEIQAPDLAYDAIRDRFFSAGSEAEAAAVMVEADKYVIESHWGVFMSGSDGFNIWQPYLKGYSNEYLGWQQQVFWSRIWIDSAAKKSLGR